MKSWLPSMIRPRLPCARSMFSRRVISSRSHSLAWVTSAVRWLMRASSEPRNRSSIRCCARRVRWVRWCSFISERSRIAARRRFISSTTTLARSASMSAFGGSHLARHAVHHAKRPQPDAVARAQRRPGVEPDVRRIDDVRIVDETRVRLRVGHHQHRVLQDGVRAKRAFAAVLAHPQPEAGLAPEPVFVQQRDGGHRHVEKPRRDARDPVERALGGCVEDLVFAQFRQTLWLVLGRRCAHTNWQRLGAFRRFSSGQPTGAGAGSGAGVADHRVEDFARRSAPAWPS